MDLLSFDPVGGVVRIHPADCANLTELCQLAEAELITPEAEPLAKAARSYAALFRACAVGGMMAGHMLPAHVDDLRRDLAGLGLGDVLSPMPGRGKATAASE
jgi:hypothetical protein